MSRGLIGYGVYKSIKYTYNYNEVRDFFAIFAIFFFFCFRLLYFRRIYDGWCNNNTRTTLDYTVLYSLRANNNNLFFIFFFFYKCKYIFDRRPATNRDFLPINTVLGGYVRKKKKTAQFNALQYYTCNR